jgi:hypothetical protein
VRIELPEAVDDRPVAFAENPEHAARQGNEAAKAGGRQKVLSPATAPGPTRRRQLEA